MEKSALLESVSVHPKPARIAAVVLLSVAVGPVPSKQFVPVPYPTKSTTDAPIGHPVVASTVVLFTRATLPAVAAIAMLPVASGVGRLTEPPAPAASCTRKYAPGWTTTFGRFVRLELLKLPTDEAYCTDQPFRLTADVPRLCSSMKSFLNVAPEFPPPPYIWLMTTVVEPAPASGAGASATYMRRTDSASTQRKRGMGSP